MAASNLPSWKYRRRAIFGTLIFGAFIIFWVVLSGDDREVLETVVIAVAGLMGAALSVYTGAAVYQDVRLPHYQQTALERGYSQDGRDNGADDGYGQEH